MNTNVLRTLLNLTIEKHEAILSGRRNMNDIHGLGDRDDPIPKLLGEILGDLRRISNLVESELATEDPRMPWGEIR